MQGLVGWWMVKSGMEEKPNYQTRPRVSTYRLFTHLSVAIVLYAGLYWNALTLLRKEQHHLVNLVNVSNATVYSSLRKWAVGLLLLVSLNLASGVTVAGIDAGKVFNTWPDMNGAFIPSSIWQKDKGWRNLFENCATVQFNHRNLGYATYFYSLLMAHKFWSQKALKIRTRFAVIGVFGLVNLQIALGVYLLLTMVPVAQASIHQVNPNSFKGK